MFLRLKSCSSAIIELCMRRLAMKIARNPHGNTECDVCATWSCLPCNTRNKPNLVDVWLVFETSLGIYLCTHWPLCVLSMRRPLFADPQHATGALNNGHLRLKKKKSSHFQRNVLGDLVTCACFCLLPVGKYTRIITNSLKERKMCRLSCLDLYSERTLSCQLSWFTQTWDGDQTMCCGKSGDVFLRWTGCVVRCGGNVLQTCCTG